MGINPALDYLSMPSSVEDRHDAVLAALALLDVHLLAVKIDAVPFEFACLKGAKAAAVDDREQRDGTLSIATSEIFFGICKARRCFTVWQRAMLAPICSNIHRINEVTNNRQQQIWSVMIAYLVTRVISREAKDKMSFPNLVCAIRLTMFSYIDIVAMVVDPLRAWRDLKKTQRKQALAYNPKYIQLSLFDDL